METEEVWPGTEQSKLLYERHFATIPDDLVLTVLKGHLLVEGQIDRLLRATFRNYKHFPRLECFDKISVVRAYYPPLWDNAWLRVISLNELRNKVAHYLEHPGVDQKIKNFLELSPIGKNLLEPYFSASAKVGMMISIVHTEVSIIAEWRERKVAAGGYQDPFI